MNDFFSSMVQILDNRLTFSAAISYFGFFQCTVCVLGFLRPISFLSRRRGLGYETTNESRVENRLSMLSNN